MDNTSNAPMPFKPNLEIVTETEELQPQPDVMEIPSAVPTETLTQISADEVEQAGTLIATQLAEAGYHPVVILGTSHSGKSCLLGSLFSYFQADPDVEIGIHLTDPVLATNSPYGREIAESSTAFFYRGVQEFLDGIAHPMTEARFPFFIPVVVRPKDGPEMKFAFLESRGEWYQPKKTTSAYFQPLKGEVEAVLRHFQGGISMIYIAPFTLAKIRDASADVSTDSREVVEAGLALVGAMNAYEALRTTKSADAHMFLVTKWDAFKKSGVDLKEILTSSRADVEEFVNTRYTQPFAVFKGLALQPQQLSLMQYCAGLISGRKVIKPSEELRPVLYRYPRTLWNWLYANAAKNSKDVGYARVLLPAPPLPRKTFLERLNEFVARILE